MVDLGFLRGGGQKNKGGGKKIRGGRGGSITQSHQPTSSTYASCHIFFPSFLGETVHEHYHFQFKWGTHTRTTPNCGPNGAGGGGGGGGGGEHITHVYSFSYRIMPKFSPKGGKGGGGHVPEYPPPPPPPPP